VKDTTLVVAGMATLSAGTYAFRLSGQVLRARISFPPRVTRLLEAAAVILLAGLVATTALTEGHGFSGFARPAGVLVAGILAWRKAPFLVVVLAAAAVTALLRLAGVSLSGVVPDLGRQTCPRQAGEGIRRTGQLLVLPSPNGAAPALRPAGIAPRLPPSR
jgi:branched chain amino acid efflux pump